jgi:hypothetical protein
MRILQLFSPLWPPFPSDALCPLYGPLSPLQPSVLSMALCSLYDPLSPVQPSENQQNKQNDPSCFPQNSKGYRDLFCISDNRNNHDYHSNKKLGDYCEIVIIALAKKLR